MDRPIVVSGAHRSGNTFTASVLGEANEAMFESREPFNRASYGLNGTLHHDYLYVKDHDEEQIRRSYAQVLTGRSGAGFPRQRLRFSVVPRPRLVLKDPLCSLSLDWLAREFDVDIVVMVRHPGAFAWSLKRVDWDPDFSVLTDQPALMEEHLSSFRNDLLRPPPTLFERAGLMWACVNTVLAGYIDQHPEWHWRRHEDLSAQPDVEIPRLFADLGLRWGKGVAAAVTQMTHGTGSEAPEGVVHSLSRDSAAVPKVWRSRLSAKEIDSVRRWVEPVADRYYDAESWAPISQVSK
jgi:hypothetical protein